jgi:Fe(II)/alpha-ketoglutarate-dependent arginine beta-hydroxylase
LAPSLRPCLPPALDRYELDGSEIEVVDRLLDRLAPRYGGPHDARFMESARRAAHDLPPRLRAFVCAHGTREGFLIAGPSVDDGRLGPTPAHWATTSPSTARYEMLLVLIGSVLGHVFGWATQQDGKFVHDILPIRGHERDQLGSGSEAELTWHTEDAFHPCRADYVGLACLRNPESVATIVGGLPLASLSPEVVELLSQRRFVIRPDPSHFAGANLDGTVSEHGQAFDRMERMNRRPDRIAILSRSCDTPNLRLDPEFMTTLPGDEPAAEALDVAVKLVNDNVVDVVLQPGEQLFLDNRRAVHGRRAFSSRHDGSDRWLKRINVMVDLARSRPFIERAGSRLIG